MMPYVCENTLVKVRKQEGRVVGVDRKNKIAVIVDKKNRIFTEDLHNLRVVSYREVY